MKDFTTVIGVDMDHLGLLRTVAPNWLKYRPEIAQNPLRVIVDSSQGSQSEWRYRVSEAIGPEYVDMKIVPYDLPGCDNQREKMLNGLFAAPTWCVDTDYFLKVDLDCVASRRCEWIKDEWFESCPAFVASPWGYTKPGSMLADCEEWSKKVPSLKSLPCSYEGDPRSQLRFGNKRVISFVYFGNTLWHRWAWGLVNMTGSDRLPCPSQDSFASWLAQKTKSHFKRVRMKRYGWHHSKPKAKSILEDGSLPE